jgi:hypothetical protein
VVESQGDYGGARSTFEQALDATRTIGDRRLECLVLGRLGSCAGDQARAWAYQKAALDVARAIGDRLACFKVLKAASDDRAEPLLARAHTELLEVTNKMELTSRRAFFQEVVSNREIVAAWE